MSLEKKGKEKIAETENIKTKTPETQMHGDDPTCTHRVSFPCSALLSLGVPSQITYGPDW